MKQLTLSSFSSWVREDMGLSSPDTTPLPTWQDGCWASHRDLEKVAAGHRIPWSHPGGSISSIAPSSGYVPGDMATPALLTAATCVTIHIYFCVDCSKKSPGFKICQANFNWSTSKFEHLHFSLVRELSIKEPWVYFMSILLRIFHVFRCFWSTHHNGRWCWADLHHKPGSPVQNT